jgi:hypothetical protein
MLAEVTAGIFHPERNDPQPHATPWRDAPAPKAAQLAPTFHSTCQENTDNKISFLLTPQSGKHRCTQSVMRNIIRKRGSRPHPLR